MPTNFAFCYILENVDYWLQGCEGFAWHRPSRPHIFARWLGFKWFIPNDAPLAVNLRSSLVYFVKLGVIGL